MFALSGKAIFASFNFASLFSGGQLLKERICSRRSHSPEHLLAGPRSAVGRAPDSQVRGPGFDTWSGHILSFLLPLIQEGQLSVTPKSICAKYRLTP